MVWALAITWLFWFTYACETVHLDDWDVCVGITKNWNTYTLTNQISNYNWWWTPSLNCDILLPDNTFTHIGACNGTFERDDNDTRKIKIWVFLNNNNRDNSIEEYYDFYHWKRTNDSTSSNNWDLDNFSFYYVGDTTPEKDERITVKIKALDNNDNRISTYNDRVTLHFDRNSHDADHYDLKITSNDFNDDEYDLDSNWDLDVYFDNWYLEFQVYFKYEDDYKITVEDGEVNRYKNFSVNTTSSSTYDADNFRVTFSPSSPEKDERVDVTVKAQYWSHIVDDYNNDIVFKIYYKSPWSSYWRATSSSTYFEINDYNDWDRDYDNWISFRSSRDWEYKFNNFIKFKKDYEYKVVVEEKNHSSIDWYDTANIYWDWAEESYVNWFTNEELETVDRIYRIWPTLIQKFKEEYHILAINSDWVELSNSLYYAMKDIINDVYNKELTNYDDFFDTFTVWYNYTISIIH